MITRYCLKDTAIRIKFVLNFQFSKFQILPHHSPTFLQHLSWWYFSVFPTRSYNTCHDDIFLYSLLGPTTPVMMKLQHLSWWYFSVFSTRSYNTCHDASVVACAFTPDSTFIVSGSSIGDLRVWDAKYGHGKALIYNLDCHDLGVTSCDFSPHIRVKDHGISGCVTYELATSGQDNLVKIWEMTADLSCACKLYIRVYSRFHFKNWNCNWSTVDYKSEVFSVKKNTHLLDHGYLDDYADVHHCCVTFKYL